MDTQVLGAFLGCMQVALPPASYERVDARQQQKELLASARRRTTQTYPYPGGYTRTKQSTHCGDRPQHEHRTPPGSLCSCSSGPAPPSPRAVRRR